MFTQIDFSFQPEGLLRLFPGGPSPYHFRKLMAKLDTQHQLALPRWFFGYPEDLTQQHAPPQVISIGITSRGLRLCGYGPRANELLAAKAGAIQAALIMASGSLVQAHLRTREHVFDFRPMPVRYYIPRLVLGKANPANIWWRIAAQVTPDNPWHLAADRKLPRQLVRGLADLTCLLLDEGDDVEGAAAGLIGRAWNGQMDWKLATAQLRERLSLKVHNVAGHEVVRTNGPTGTCICLRHVEFTMNAQIEGGWTLGRDRIGSSGEVLRSTREWITEAAA